jgi:hypothetical protein
MQQESENYSAERNLVGLTGEEMTPDFSWNRLAVLEMANAN